MPALPPSPRRITPSDHRSTRGVNVSGALRRRAAAVLACATALALVACGAPLPDSVVAGSSTTVGWTHTLTSTNPATSAGTEPGNQDLAVMTRGQFARTVEGVTELDESFGTATITDPETFTVRYDLAETDWSDGIPLDTADLMLAWAAGTGILAQERSDDAAVEGDGKEGAGKEEPAEQKGESKDADAPDPITFDARTTGLRESLQIVDYDEFDRWIEVQFSHPIDDWQTALNVAVPAHVVGQRALGIEDPMAAKHAVMSAILDRDRADLRAIAKVWNTGFELPEGDGSNIPADLLVSSGPYRIVEIDQSRKDAQNVRLVVNKHYSGEPAPEFETIVLRHTDGNKLLQEIGDSVNVVQVRPTPENFTRVRDLERLDYNVSAGGDRTTWALILNVNRGEFTWHNARVAFMRAVRPSEIREAAAGSWSSSYGSTDSLLFSPGAEGYEIAQQDSGLKKLLAGGAGEPAEEREAIGVDAGTEVCVLYDTDSHFASAGFAALKKSVAEAGWDIKDCGAEDIDTAVQENKNWDAVLTRIPVPSEPAEIAAQWGSKGAQSLSGVKNDKRDELIAELARTPDYYAARDLRVQIESTIVDDALALPIATQPVLTISDRQVVGAQPPPGAPVTFDSANWAIPDEKLN